MENNNTPSLLTENDMESLTHLLNKVRPLLELKRFDNIIDVLSLVSDLVDIMDNNTVDKMSMAFEDILAPVWSSSTAFNMAKMELLHTEKKFTLGSTFSLLKDQNTLKGLFLLLRTLQIMGQNSIKE